MNGLYRLLWFSLRRSRVLLLVWVAVLAVMCFVSAAATERLYPTAVDRASAAEAINSSSALVALYGPILDVRSLGELAMTKTTVTYAVFVMVLVIVLVRRHTRVEEESGRAELVGALAVSPGTPLVGALLLGVLASLAVATSAALADIAGGLPVAGSLWFAGSWLGLGLVGTGIGAVSSQLSASARTCGAVAAGVVVVLYALRAVGDTSVGWVGWLSPLGWSTRLRAWSDPRGWVLLLDVSLAGLLAAAALVLRARRDLGSGLLAERPGRAAGSPRLADAFALNLRMHAPTLVIWTVASAVLGALMAAIVPSVGSMLDSPGSRDMVARLGGTGAIQESVVSALASVTGIVVACFAVIVVGHGGADEHDGRTEEVLATATSRTGTFVAVGAIAMGGATWLLLVIGLALGIGSNGASIDFDRMLGAALVQAPAVWIVASLALLGLAQGSHWALAGWVVLAAFFLVGPLAELLRLPGWVGGLSPYSHVPRVPAEPLTLAPELVLTAIAAVLAATAFGRYRGRDIG